METVRRETRFCSGQIRVDSGARTVFVDDKPAKLGGRAFDLLDALIARRDRVVPKQELMDIVWAGLVVEENNLQVHVTTLRKILGHDSIVTVSGRGYRFALDSEVEEESTGGRSAASVSISPQAQFPSAPTTLLIGREALTASVTTLVRRKDVRLVTLAGPGGAGKTRLGLQVSAELAHDFADGCYIVMLAPVRDAANVPRAIADVFGIRESNGRSADDLLVGHLSDREVLLTLDNFEHVPEAVRLITKLLDVCKGLKVLVTSRLVLRIPSEHLVAVPPLALPGPSTTNPEVAMAPAVRLFIQRAQAAGQMIGSTDRDFGIVADICQRLDGLPLAIELAAARLRVLSPEALLTRLDHRLQLLKSGQRDLPERQNSLRNTIAWSHDLLSADGQVLFRRLSVFSGGWSLEAAEMVAAEGLTCSVLDTIEQLIDQSLVQRIDDINGDPRFAMLETLREYAAEQLAVRGERAAVRLRHADYFMRLAERTESHLTSVQRAPWLVLLEAENNNFRAALAWLIREKGDVEGALRLAGVLPWMWYFTGRFSEGRAWLGEALALPGAEEHPVARAKVLSGASRLAIYAGDPELAVELAGQSIALWRGTDDRRGLAFALFHQGVPSMILRHSSAQALFEECVDCFRQAGDPWGVALATTYIGILFSMMPGQEEPARKALGEGRASFDAMGDDWGGTTDYYLGAIAYRQGNYAEAREHVESVLAVSRDVGDHFRVCRSLHLLAEISFAQDRPDEAMGHLKASIGMTREQGRFGDLAQQLRLMARSEVVHRRHDRAARLFAAASQLSSYKSTLPPDDPKLNAEALDAVRQALGVRRFDSETAYGAAMSTNDMVKWILVEGTPGGPDQN